MAGVLSSASKGRTRIRNPRVATTWTGCSPTGQGSLGSAEDPSGGRAGSPRGRVTSEWRSARSSQVSTMISVPTARSRNPSATSGWQASQASGAPSSPLTWLLRAALQRCARLRASMMRDEPPA